jgi:ATP-binding cassette subfamily B protein
MSSRHDKALLRWCVRQEGRRIALGLGASVALQTAYVAIPWCVANALDHGITKGDALTTLEWALVIVGFGALLMVGEIIRGITMRIAADSVGNKLRMRILERVLVLDQQSLDKYGHGDLSMRATRDADLLHFWVYGLSLWAQVITTFVLVGAAIGTLEPLLLAVAGAAVPFLVVLNLFYPKQFGRATGELANAHSARANAVEELLSATVAVRGIGGETALVRRHDEHSAVVTDKTHDTARIAANWASQVPMIPRLAIAAGIGVGGMAVLDGALTIGGLVAFISWMQTVTIAVAVLVQRLDQRAQALVSAGRIVEILNLRTDVPPDAIDELTPGGQLEARGVSVAIDGRNVLDQVSLTARAGELVAVTGPTGSGKSTLLRALARSLAPSRGVVTYGGVDLASVTPDAARRRITLVPQRPLLLSGTIADNLRLGRAISDDELQRACEITTIAEDIAEFPEGYQTEVGERGTTLSGGQVQRLALARSLLQKCDVLLLDDATSAVDVATERKVLERLRAWASDTAIVFATHRQAVLDAADRVVPLALPAEVGITREEAAQHA